MKKNISNWGLFPSVKTEKITGKTTKSVSEEIKSFDKIIARGNGRCYGDASLQNHIFSTLTFNHYLTFDKTTGILSCESGVLLDNIVKDFVPKGYFLPITPGTKFITIGGAIASDVHGKNHHKDGCFSDFLESFKLVDHNGITHFCSKTENIELFWSTIGGMGHTGIITEAQFYLKKIESRYIRQESIKAKNLKEIFDLFEKSNEWTYTVAWIDCLQKGKTLGRSILLRGEHAKSTELSVNQLSLENPVSKPKNVPFFFPNFVLNKFGVKLFNFLFYYKQIRKFKSNFIDLETYFYPLDSIHNWNKIYGKKGFIQYQFVIPKHAGYEGMSEVLNKISQSGEGSFLAVLKLFGSNNPLATNSFPIEGYTLALDFKLNDKLPILIKELDSIVQKYKGRIYRAKDALSTPDLTNYVTSETNTKFVSLQSERYKK